MDQFDFPKMVVQTKNYITACRHRFYWPTPRHSTYPPTPCIYACMFFWVVLFFYRTHGL